MGGECVSLGDGTASPRRDHSLLIRWTARNAGRALARSHQSRSASRMAVGNSVPAIERVDAAPLPSSNYFCPTRRKAVHSAAPISSREMPAPQNPAMRFSHRSSLTRCPKNARRQPLTRFDLTWDGQAMNLPERFWNDLPGLDLETSFSSQSKINNPQSAFDNLFQFPRLTLRRGRHRPHRMGPPGGMRLPLHHPLDRQQIRRRPQTQVLPAA